MKRKPVMIRIALFAVAFLAAAGAQAQVYKCVDAAGKVVYTQDPCPANMKSDTMTRNRPSAPAAPPADPSADKTDKADKAAKGDAAKSAAPKTAAEQEQAFRKRQQDQAKAAKESEQKSAEAQRKGENCRSAKERLTQFEIGGRMSRINAQGERYYLEDAQIEQEKARARAEVALHCN
ncbi:MAG TPA: DUF4124 domain-containing protein [Burkholderiales bacterium]|nr:DUF4124 domain-containing protein [Burkholderiales bacterium]